jgi:hypothetical protein
MKKYQKDYNKCNNNHLTLSNNDLTKRITYYFFTPFRIEDAQSASPSPLITARFAGVLNEKRCKG